MNGEIDIFKRPIGWWRCRIIGGIAYNLSQATILGDTVQAYFVRIYYSRLNKMVNIYKIDWYGFCSD